MIRFTYQELYDILKYKMDYTSEEIAYYIWNLKEFNYEEVAKTMTTVGSPRIVSDIEDCGYITILDDNYPDVLTRMVNPPLVLFYNECDPNIFTLTTLGAIGRNDNALKDNDEVAKILNNWLKAKDKHVVVFPNNKFGQEVSERMIINNKNIDNIRSRMCFMSSAVDQNFQLYKGDIVYFTEMPQKAPKTADSVERRNRIMAHICKGVFISGGQKSGPIQYFIQELNDIGDIAQSHPDIETKRCLSYNENGRYNDITESIRYKHGDKLWSGPVTSNGGVRLETLQHFLDN